MNEHALYRSNKTLWAILLFMKYTHNNPRWRGIREAIRAELSDDEEEEMRKGWVEAKQRSMI